MPRNYTVEIRGADWTIESRKFHTKEEAEKWFQEEFNMINGDYTVAIIDWSKQEANNSMVLS